MRIAVTSDWHGYLPRVMPEVDLVLFAGDLGIGENFGSGGRSTFGDYARYLGNLRKDGVRVVGVAGNHDRNPELLRQLPWTYLEDECVTVHGLKIWGTPWSNPFGHGWAFNMSEEQQVTNLLQVPEDVSVIVSHGPPYGYQDHITSRDGDRTSVGSRALRERMQSLSGLKLVACGHVHDDYGASGSIFGRFTVVNGSLVAPGYKHVNSPIIIGLPNKG